MLRRQADRAVSLIRLAQSAHLAACQTQHPGRLYLRQLLLDHTLNHAHAIQLPVAQCQCLHAPGIPRVDEESGHFYFGETRHF